MFHVNLALLITYHSILGEAHLCYHIQLVKIIYPTYVIVFYVKIILLGGQGKKDVFSSVSVVRIKQLFSHQPMFLMNIFLS